MTHTNHGTGNDPVPAEVNADWAAFEVSLAGYLATMSDPDEGDHLLIEVTDPDPDGAAGCPPYAQFAACGDGKMIRAEISGDAYLRPQFRLGMDAAVWFTRKGWAGGASADADEGEERNWYVFAPLDHSDEVARVVVEAMRDRFGMVHPQLLTYQAWGPGSDEPSSSACARPLRSPSTSRGPSATSRSWASSRSSRVTATSSSGSSELCCA